MAVDAGFAAEGDRRQEPRVLVSARRALPRRRAARNRQRRGIEVTTLEACRLALLLNRRRLGPQRGCVAALILEGSLAAGRPGMWVRERQEIGTVLKMSKSDLSEALAWLEREGIVKAEQNDEGWTFALRPDNLMPPPEAMRAWARIKRGRDDEPQLPIVDERRDAGFGAAMTEASQNTLAERVNNFPVGGSELPERELRVSAEETFSSRRGNSEFPERKPLHVRAPAHGEPNTIRNESIESRGRRPQGKPKQFRDPEQNRMLADLEELCSRRTSDENELEAKRGWWIVQIQRYKNAVFLALGEVKAWCDDPTLTPPESILAVMGRKVQDRLEGRANVSADARPRPAVAPRADAGSDRRELRRTAQTPGVDRLQTARVGAAAPAAPPAGHQQADISSPPREPFLPEPGGLSRAFRQSLQGAQLGGK